MNTKIKTIILTFLATTIFWCLAIVCAFSLGAPKPHTTFIQDAVSRGFRTMFSARNTESQPLTFTIVELRTNTPSANEPEIVLLERQLPPRGEFWIGIKETKTENK